MAKSKKRAGRDDRATRASETQELLNGKPGRVVAHHGVAVLVRFDDGVERQIWLTPGQQAVAGDRVIVAGERLAVEPAHGILRRRDARGRERTIAVNLDVLGIVVAPEPREPPGYIDRGFVIARAAGIEAEVIVNKLDLEGGRELADRLSEIYGASSHVHARSGSRSRGVRTQSQEPEGPSHDDDGHTPCSFGWGISCRYGGLQGFHRGRGRCTRGGSLLPRIRIGARRRLSLPQLSPSNGTGLQRSRGRRSRRDSRAATSRLRRITRRTFRVVPIVTTFPIGRVIFGAL